jgi:hypothetical protein
MSGTQTVGWFLYTVTEWKKQKAPLRWVTVVDHWLLISAKANEPALLSLHLGFVEFSPASADQNMPPNTLVFRTLSFFGPLPGDSLVLYSHNRFDILNLNDAVTLGKHCWDEYLSRGPPQPPLSYQFLMDKKALGAKKWTTTLGPDGLKMSGSKGLKNFDFAQIERVRPVLFDKLPTFEITVSKPGNKPETMSFACQNQADMRNWVTVFLYYLARRGD